MNSFAKLRFHLVHKRIRETSNYAFYFVMGLLCFLLFGLVTILNVPVYIFRALVIRSAKYVRPDLGTPLDPLSSGMAGDIIFSNKPPRGNLVLFATVERQLALTDFEKLVMDKWILQKERNKAELKYPQFSQFPVSWLGFMFWKTDKHFDIKNHIHCYSNGNNDVEVTEKELDELVETVLNAPHHPNRSPWKFHLINNYRNPKLHDGEMSVFVFKVHHCLGDGYSLLNAFTNELFVRRGFQLPNAKFQEKGFWKRLIYILTVPIIGAFELIRLFQEGFKDSPWKIPDEEKEWYQLYGKSDCIPIQKIKQVKNQFGVSFTSVLLSAISAGIYRNLEGKRMNGTLRAKNLDKTMHCSSILPLPGRRSKGRLSNHATAALFNVPAGPYNDPLERLQECNRILERTKNSVVPALISWYVALNGWHFGWVTRFIMKNRTIPTGLTNFPSVGNDFKGILCGRRLLSSDFASGASEGVAGVGFMVLSYCDYIRVAVTAEKGLMTRDELDSLIKSIENEISTLYSICKNTPVQMRKNVKC